MWTPKYRKIHCENTELYQTKEIEDSWQGIFKRGNVKDRVSAATSYGRTSTTVQLDLVNELLRRKILPLVQWIHAEALAHSEYFCGSRAVKIKELNLWANQMQLHSGVKIHRHMLPDQPGVVGIFYFKAPQGSANFVLVNDPNLETKIFDKIVEDYAEQDRIAVPVQTGDLVLHQGNLAHGTPAHTLVETRECLVLNLAYEFNQ